MEESARKDREVHIEGFGSGDPTVVRSAFTNGEVLMAEPNVPDTRMSFAGDKTGQDSMVEGALPKTLYFEEQGCNEKDTMGASMQGANSPWCNVGTSGQNRVDKNPLGLGDVAGGFTSYRDMALLETRAFIATSTTIKVCQRNRCDVVINLHF